MNMIKKLEEPITRGIVIFLLFLFVSLLLSNPIRMSIENILLSRAKVHSKSYSFALTPVIEQNHLDGKNKISLLEANSFDTTGNIVTNDARATALRQFLMDYNSPMYPYAEVFVTEADKYGLDWRLVAAISGVESSFGLLPVRANNAWGWKGGSDGDFNPFDTWGHGVEVVTRRLALGYGIHMTPFDIEPIYCPPCGENPDSLWANGVVKFMNQIEMYRLGF